MQLSRKGNCPACRKALRKGLLYLNKGVIYHLVCLYPPLPLPANPMPHTTRFYAETPLPPHDAQ